MLSPQILLSFTLFFLLLAVFSNWVRHTVIISTLKRIKAVFSRCVLGVWEKRGRGGGREGGGKRMEEKRDKGKTGGREGRIVEGKRRK